MIRHRTRHWIHAAMIAAVVLPLAACASTRSPGEEISDAALTTRVKARLAADPDVGAHEIDVDTLDGVVRLSGKVPNRIEYREAAEIAGRTEGVRGVDNDLEIGNPTIGERIDDTVLGTRVKAALVDDGQVKARNIDVDVVDGVVTLSGQVESAEHRRMAAEIARGVKGVSEVRNLLEVRAS